MILWDVIKGIKIPPGGIMLSYFADKYGESKVWEICKTDSLKKNNYYLETIIDVAGNPFPWLSDLCLYLMTSETFSDYDDNFVYTTGEIVQEKHFHTNKDFVCEEGIHFYQTKETAFFHNFYIGNYYTGPYKTWYENGQPSLKENYVDGKRQGLRKEWWENGQLFLKENLVDGKLHGLREVWYENGQQCVKTNFVDGKRHGLSEEWWENGQLFIKANYVDGKLQGLCEGWHSTGKQRLKENYVEGRLCIQKK
jgi:antitoxin component YwqK of YwqJK toxin-antitoxin module